MREKYLNLRETILFKTQPEHFVDKMKTLRSEWEKEHKLADDSTKSGIIEIIKEITIDLASYLPNWHLLKSGSPLLEGVLDNEVQANLALLKELGALNEVKYIENEINVFKNSSLIRLSQMADKNKINTRWGNDYATGLTHALRRGAVLVTTNPPLIDIARKSNPAMWNPVRDEIKNSFPDYSTEQLCSLMTMRVVLANCREIRPIYEATKGEFGYVSLQVNPKNYTDAKGMITEAQMLYAKLEDEIGGTPNVVFKLPATKAGIEAVEKLTGQGMGVNVTVNFAVAQEVAFAEAIEKGNAKTSFLTLMSGRLDDPIRDELLSLGVPDAEIVARWGGVAVARRVYDIIYRQKNYTKSYLLQASLRGPWNIDELVTDEQWKIFITVFPDKAEEYDSTARDIRPRMREQVPSDMLDKLNLSKIFRQAYETDGLKIEEFDTYLPVAVTLRAFGKAYDDFLEYLA